MQKRRGVTLFLSILFVFLLQICIEASPAPTRPPVENSKIGAMTGSTGEKFISTQYPQSKISSFDSIADAMMALQSNKLDYVITTLTTAVNYVNNNKDLTIFKDGLLNEGVAIAVAKENPEMLQQIQDVLTKYKQDGTLDQVISHWIKKDGSPYDIEELPKATGDKILTVAIAANREPMCFVKDNQYEGLDCELIERIAYELGMQVKYTDMQFSALIPALQSGKADVIISNMTPTEERKKNVNFTEEYFQNPQVLVAKKEATPEVAPVDTAATTQVDTAPSNESRPPVENSKIGAMTGSTGEKFVSAQYPQAKISSFDAIADAMMALQSNKLDYVITTLTTAVNFVNNNKDLTIFKDGLLNEGVAIAVAKENPALLQQIQDVLTKYKQDGTLDKVISHWIKKDGSPYEIEELPKATGDKILTVAIAANRESMCFVKDNQYKGLDCELIERIAYELGMQVKYTDMQFSALIPALQSGKADVIISNMTPTEERKKNVNFTEEYFQNPQVLVAKKEATPEVAAPTFLQKLGDDFNQTFITEARYVLIWSGTKATLIITLLSAVFGTLLGFVMSVMLRSKSALANVPARILSQLLQGTPMLVILMILYYIIFGGISIDPIAVAIVGFSLTFANAVGGMLNTGIDAVEKGQIEAALATGFSRFEVYWKITFPQAARMMLPMYRGEIISMLKMTSIVGYIAIQDLTKMSDIIRSRTYQAFFPLIATAVIYFIMAYVVRLALSSIEVRIDPKRRKRMVKGVVER